MAWLGVIILPPKYCDLFLLKPGFWLLLSMVRIGAGPAFVEVVIWRTFVLEPCLLISLPTTLPCFRSSLPCLAKSFSCVDMEVTVLPPGAVSYKMCYLSTLEYLSLFGASIKFANWPLFSC